MEKIGIWLPVIMVILSGCLAIISLKPTKKSKEEQ